MELAEFLIETKKQAYMSPGGLFEKYESTDDGFLERVASQGGFTYRDRCVGTESFAGEEVVLLEGVPIWAMNYCGEMLDPGVPSRELYEFICLALMESSAKMPCRGPKYFYTDKFAYLNHAEGELEKFMGKEHVLLDGEEVYRLYYHGGSIK